MNKKRLGLVSIFLKKVYFSVRALSLLLLLFLLFLEVLEEGEAVGERRHLQHVLVHLVVSCDLKFSGTCQL